MGWVEALALGIASFIGILLRTSLKTLYAIVRGELVPAVTVEKRESDWRERLAESRERETIWRDAHGVSEANVTALTEQVRKLTITGETSLALLQALPRKEQA